MKEQFFEALGLPGDLNNLAHYNFADNNPVYAQPRQDNKSPSTRAPAAAGDQPKERKEILTLTIEIGEGRSENILICEGDVPFQLAADFDNRYQIGA